MSLGSKSEGRPHILIRKEKVTLLERMDAAIPLALDSGLSQPKVVVCAILRYGDMETDKNHIQNQI